MLVVVLVMLLVLVLAVVLVLALVVVVVLLVAGGGGGGGGSCAGVAVELGHFEKTPRNIIHQHLTPTARTNKLASETKIYVCTGPDLRPK